MRKVWQAPVETNKDTYSQSDLFGLILVLGVIALFCYSLFVLINETNLIPGDPSNTKAKLSWYWPPLLGPNCAVSNNGECVSRMASGRSWQKWVDQAVACPEEYPFGTEFVIDGKEWICLDRGGAITRINDNLIWLDMLTKKPQYAFGAVVDVSVIGK